MTTRLATALLAAAVGTILSAPASQAFPPSGVPSTTNPGLLNGNGAGSSAIFAFADAADASILNLTGFGSNPIFNNNVNTPGNTVNLGALSGPQQFGLNNLTTGTNFLANVADANGNYHAFYSASFADFGVGSLPAAAAAVIAVLPSSTSVTFVGWEDLTAGQGSDFDYNDLIFAFSNLTPAVTPSIPEPGTLSMLAAGLLGLSLVRRRKKR